jgi:hypothetical protein
MSEHQDPRRTRRQAQLKIWGIPVGTPPPGIQVCALAQTLALWLMGHEDAKVRERLLTAHIETVRALIEK